MSYIGYILNRFGIDEGLNQNLKDKQQSAEAAIAKIIRDNKDKLSTRDLNKLIDAENLKFSSSFAVQRNKMALDPSLEKTDKLAKNYRKK